MNTNFDDNCKGPVFLLFLASSHSLYAYNPVILPGLHGARSITGRLLVGRVNIARRRLVGGRSDAPPIPPRCHGSSRNADIAVTSLASLLIQRASRGKVRGLEFIKARHHGGGPAWMTKAVSESARLSDRRRALLQRLWRRHLQQPQTPWRGHHTPYTARLTHRWVVHHTSKGATTGRPDPQNLDRPPQLFWWRVWLPLRNRLQCTKLDIPSLFCSVQ